MAERLVMLAGETDLEGFRRHARDFLARGVEPECVRWQVATRAEGDLFAGVQAAGTPTAPCLITGTAPSAATIPPHAQEGTPAADQLVSQTSAPTIKVPSFFVPLLERAALHADPDRFGLLYRLLWRLVKNPGLRHDPLDADRQQAELMARGVRRDMHKMTAFVRFRPLAGEGGEPTEHVAWFEPEHYIVEATAPFFVRRFARMHWAILTPRLCARWDGESLTFGPGARPGDAPPADASEQLWLTYYASIFNPARLKLAMMQKEMPRRYWKNLPEAVLIHPLTTSAAARCASMADQDPKLPARRRPSASKALTRSAEPVSVGDSGRDPERKPASLPALRDATQRCRECPLGERATQAVNGSGNEHARLVLVGEQPGDREDLAGLPFVGPAGQLLDRALQQLGWPRDEIFLTNAVRHFKFELRGKRRIHKTPGQQEMAACLHWLEAELELVKPKAAIALGATAARALLGRPVAVMKERGQWLVRDDGLRVLVTLHPSALLRSEQDLEPAFAAWLADLRHAAHVLEPG